MRSTARDDLRKHLSANGVGTDVHFPLADHLQPAYLTDAPQSLPVTEAACDSVVSLPCYPGLAQDAQATVIEALRAFPRWAG